MRDDDGDYDIYDAGAPDAEAWLGELLDAEAAGYEPDTERLRALVAARIAAAPDGRAGRRGEHGARGAGRRSGRDPGARTGARPRRLAVLGRIGLAGIPAGFGLATIGAAAALAVGATATIAVTSNHDRPTTTVAVLTPHSGGPGGGAASQGPSTGPSPQSPGGGGTQRPSPPGGTQGASGPAGPASSSGATGSSGSNALFTVTTQIDPHTNPGWTELNLWVAAKQPLTSLTVTIRVARCASLASDSGFDDGGGDVIASSETTNGDGSLTYTFVLRAGKTVNPGGKPIEFAGQFTHAAGGWNAADDGYTVDARTAASAADSVLQGGF